MISIIENTFPMVSQYRASEYISQGGIRTRIAVIPEPKTSQIDVDWLSQGLHDHLTSWSSVYHAKAFGSCTRFNDEWTHSFPDDSDKPDSKWEWYVVNGLRLNYDKYDQDHTIGTCLGQNGIAIRQRLRLETAATRTVDFVFVAWSTDVKDGNLYVHHFVHNRRLIHYKLTNRLQAPGSGSGSRNIGGTLPPYPLKSYNDNMTLEQGRTHLIEYCLKIVASNRTYASKTYQYGTTFPPPQWYGRYLTDQAIAGRVRKEIQSLIYRCHDEQSNIRSELEAQAFDSINRFDGNLLAFLPSLKEFGTGTASTLLEVLNGEPNKKAVAALWLTARYGDRLTISDTRSLIGSLSRDPAEFNPYRYYLRGRSRTQSVVDEDSMLFNVNIAIIPNDYNALMKLVRKAYEWDFYPSLGNVWDMIPLSFVVDWFVNVSDIWESCDRMIQSRYYSVHRVMHSVKATRKLRTIPGVTISYYERTMDGYLSLGMSSIELGLPSMINVIDGVTLFLM